MSTYDELIRKAWSQLQLVEAQALSVEQQVETAKTYALLALAEAIRSKSLAVSISAPPRAASGQPGSFAPGRRRTSSRDANVVRRLPREKSPPRQEEKTKVILKAKPDSGP